MKSVSLSGSLRGNVGKKDAKANRRQGLVPCVLYGGKEQLHFLLEDKAFRKIIFTPEVYLVNLNIDGKEILATLQDVQYHPVTDNILHVDFLEVHIGKPVIIAVPVKIEGTAPGVLKGGRLIFKMRKVKIKAQPEILPDHIIIKIDDLEVGDSVKVGDLKYDNMVFLDAPSTVIVGVRTARAVVEEEKPGEVAAAAVEGAEEKPEPEKK